MARTPREVAADLLPLAVAFAVGLVLMGYSAVTYLTYASLRANPSVRTVSTSTGFEVVVLLGFALGAVVAFLAAFLAAHRLRPSES